MCLVAVIVLLTIHKTIGIYNNSRISVHCRYYVMFSPPPRPTSCNVLFPSLLFQFIVFCKHWMIKLSPNSSFSSCTIRHSATHVQYPLTYFKKKAQGECLGWYRKRASRLRCRFGAEVTCMQCITNRAQINFGPLQEVRWLGLFSSDQIYEYLFLQEKPRLHLG
jgi:hypothetical protein